MYYIDVYPPQDFLLQNKHWMVELHQGGPAQDEEPLLSSEM